LNCKSGSVHLTGYYLSDQCSDSHEENADLMEMMKRSGMQPGDDFDEDDGIYIILVKIFPIYQILLGLFSIILCSIRLD